jgi:hypothetical protein
MCIDEQLLVLGVFDQTKVVVEVVGKEKGEVADKLLVVVVRGSIGGSHICTWWYHSIDTRHDDVEEGDEFPIVFWSYRQSCNLAQTL